jgi:hypothetical protein
MSEEALVTKEYFENALGRLENKLDARFNAIDPKFNAIDAKFNAVDNNQRTLLILAIITGLVQIVNFIGPAGQCFSVF